MSLYHTKRRTEKSLKLPEPISVVVKDRWISPEWQTAKLIGFTWLKVDHPNAIIQLPSGEERKIENYHVDNKVIFIDHGDGLQVTKEIREVTAERDKVLAQFRQILDALESKIPPLDYKALIEKHIKDAK